MTPLQEKLKKLFNKKQKKAKRQKSKDPFVDGSFMDSDFWLDELDDVEGE